MTEVTRTYDVTIKSFNKKGQGVTKYRRDDWEGKGKNLSLTIPRTIPGEVVRVEVPNAMNRKSAFTHPIEIIKKMKTESTHRVNILIYVVDVSGNILITMRN